MISLIKRTKCVTTLGPSSSTEEAIQKLVENGSTCVRINFSHGNHEEHGKRVVVARNVSAKLNIPIAIMLDTRGPEVRTHTFTNGSANIAKDSEITIIDNQEIVGSNKKFSINYSQLSQDVKVGTIILVDDGKLQLEVLKINGHEIFVKALNTHTIKDRRALNIPNVVLSLPFISEKDRQDLVFGCQQKVDFVAASFVGSATDVKAIRKILDENDGKHIKIISKIESQVGVNNFDKILEASDAIMVARGDLGVEIPFEKVPFYEHQWIKKCQKVNKPIIVATQMLDSMIENPHPTRAEVTDVFVAVQWGTSVTMLSGESANGNYPDLSIATMSTIIKESESHYNWEEHQEFVKTEDKVVKQIIEFVNKENPKYLFINDNEQVIKTISNLHLPIITIPLVNEEIIYRGYALNYGVYPCLVKNGDNKTIFDNHQELQTLVNQTYKLKTKDKVLVINTNGSTKPALFTIK